MSLHSLRLRLLLISIFSITTALIVASYVLVGFFEHHVERRVYAELTSTIGQLAGNLGFAKDGQMTLSNTLADPRFARPLSGLYWQIQEKASGNRLRSRSLWDFLLPLPADELETGGVHQHRLAGPGKSALIAQERLITYDSPDGPRTIRVAVAIDAKTVAQAAAAFAADVRMPLLSLALFLYALAGLVIWFGLHPLEAVRRSVKQIRSGAEGRLVGPFPDEVMPLIAEMNGLLDAQDRSIEQAHNQAANLAHGLKTPLTIILSDAEKLKREGQVVIANELAGLSRQMQRYIDRELTRARIAIPSALRFHDTSDLVEIIRSVIATLQRTPQGEILNWEIEGPATCTVTMNDNDLADVVGNVLENASKWASTSVHVRVIQEADQITFSVTDDGPGAPSESLKDLLQRGIRLDEKKAGSGIGLAIVDDIASAYGGKVVLKNPPAGGFEVAVNLPGAN